MVWGKAGSTTLSSAGDNITVSDMTASENNAIMLHKINSGNVNPLLTFNSDSGSNYAWRYSSNGGTDSTVTNGTKLEMAVTGITPTLFTIFYVNNISAEEKLVIGNTVEQNTAGAGTAPQRMEVVGKWTNTSSQITALNFGNDATGDYAIDSNASVLGSDLTPAAAVPALGANIQAGSRYEETDTRKMYSLTDPLIADDDFTSYADISAGNAVWVSENTSYSYVDVNNDNLKINQPYSTSVHAYVAKDLGNNVSNTVWGCRYKLNFSTWNTSSEFHLTLHEADQTVANNATGYNVAGIRISAQSSPDRIQVIATSSGSDRSFVGSGSSFTVSTGTDYYVEMIRDGDDFTVTVRTGSHSGTVSATTTETVSGIDSLRYFKISNIDWDTTTSVGDIVCTLDDFEFYNGSTTRSNYWQEIGA